MSERALEVVIGLEVHVRLDTGGKLFCGCRLPHDRRELAANTSICDVCTGHPGTMPQLQTDAVLYGLALALALGAEPEDLRGASAFERKHYFYWDLPKNYQITQIDSPLCPRTRVRVLPEDGGEPFEVVLDRIHLEEDAASKQEDEREIRVDFNRSSTVLAEIVTEPGFRSVRQVADFLRHLRRTLRWHNLGSAETGDFRCDVNLSVRWRGEELNPKVELKNMSTLEGLVKAAQHEVERLTQVLKAGGAFEQETREWIEERQETKVLRTKESAGDYWYYFEPDLLDVEVTDRHLEAAGNLLRPPLAEVVERLRRTGFQEDEIRAVFSDSDYGFLVDYVAAHGVAIRECRAFAEGFKAVAGDLEARRREDSTVERHRCWSSAAASFEKLWTLIRPNLDLLVGAVKEGTVNAQHLKVLAEKKALTAGTWSSVEALFADFGLEQAPGGDDLEAQVTGQLESVLADHAEQRDAWLREGDPKLFNFFQGQLMRRLPRGTDGKAVREILVRYRDAPRS